MSNENISLYSINDLKNSSDDAIPAYLNSIKFQQSHRLCDIRLALGFGAISISAATFLWDFKFGFESTKVYTTIAVLIYTILNGILTYWMNFVEKGIIYIGKNKQGDKIQISSRVDKYIPNYYLTIVTYPRNQLKNPYTVDLKKSFNGWFNEAGYFVPLPFQQMLASNVPLIGVADPTKVVSQIADKSLNSESNDKKKDIKNLDEKHSKKLAVSSGVDSDRALNVKASKVGRKKG